MADLADLLEHEDEVRSEVLAAVAYPGIRARIWRFHRGDPAHGRAAAPVRNDAGNAAGLPLPTLILLKVSEGLHRDWYWFCWPWREGLRRTALLRSPAAAHWDGSAAVCR